jgi:hypothetical protein
MYYSVQNGESRRDGGRVGIIHCHALFVLKVGIPDWMGEKVLADCCGATFEKSRQRPLAEIPER